MGYGGTGSDHPGLLPLDKKHPDVKYIFRSGDVDDDYEVEKDPIARGKFAAVRLVRHRITKEIFAAKYLRRRGRAASLESEARHEIAVLLLGRTDPYIIHLHQVYEARSEYVIILEFGSGGDLQRLLDDQSRFSEKTVRDLLIQVLRGLTFLHERRIAHLDIKPQNLVLMGPAAEDGVKLVDFGLSRVILETGELTQIMGTPDYVAPEVINFEPVGLATDMWSIGVLTYVFLTGCTPFGGNTDQDTFVNITQGEFDFPDDLFEDVSIHAKDYISSLLIKSTHLRMNVEQSINHSWICASNISEADSADSGYSAELLNGSPPCNLMNGYLSSSVTSLSCQCPIISEESLQSCDSNPSMESSVNRNLNQHRPLHDSSEILSPALHNGLHPNGSLEPERRPRASAAHVSINVMESLRPQNCSQLNRSHRRNSLVIDNLRYSDNIDNISNNHRTIKNKRFERSESECLNGYNDPSPHFSRANSCVGSWSSYSDVSNKRLPEMILDRVSLRNITKPWENLCDGSYVRAINQLQSKGAQKKSKPKQPKSYFGLRPELSYSMYDLKSVTADSHSPIMTADINLRKSELKKSKAELLRGSKSELRKSKSELRVSKSDHRSSNKDLTTRDEANQRRPKSESSPTKYELRKSKTSVKPKLDKSQRNWPLSSQEAWARLNASLSRLDLSDVATGDEESEERDVVYGDFTLPRRFSRSRDSQMLRGNSLHMSFRLPKKKDGNM